MKHRSKLVCCRACGKDTIAPSGYCSQCFGGHHKQVSQKRIVNGAVVTVEQEKRTVAEEYNGESERDDI